MSKVERCSVLIVGAGLAGLSAAHHLRAAGRDDVIVVEAEDRPGGWAKTDWSGPWGSDRAIHVLYFRDPEIRAWAGQLLGGVWREHRKRAIIDSRGVRTLFPFHANLYGRPAEVILDCLNGMWDASQARPDGPPVTFADWIARTHGAGVARHFMDPYNTKQWTVPPGEMGWDWMGDFIPSIDGPRILEGALRPADESIGLNATFHYPPHGASSLSEALAATAGPIRYSTALVTLDAAEHVATLSDGTTVRYETLISTAPLQTLGRWMSPLRVREDAAWRRLESIDLVLVDVGFRDAGPCDIHWVYLPDPDVLAYRIHVVHALSDQMTPPGHGLYCLEISHSRHRPLPAGDLRARVIDDLVRTGWLRDAGQVAFSRERRFPCSYVIPRVGFKQDAAALRCHALRYDIHSIGRYGEWKYCNQEDAILDGRRTARLLVEAAAAR